jgi:Tfp pilus assembly protein PilW
MRSPQLGLKGKLEVLSCQDASKQGVACKLSPQAASASQSGTVPDLSVGRRARNALRIERQAIGQFDSSNTSIPDTVALFMTGSKSRLIFPCADGWMFENVLLTTRMLPPSL